MSGVTPPLLRRMCKCKGAPAPDDPYKGCSATCPMTPDVGATTAIYLASEEALSATSTGQFFGPNNLMGEGSFCDLDGTFHGPCTADEAADLSGSHHRESWSKSPNLSRLGLDGQGWAPAGPGPSPAPAGGEARTGWSAPSEYTAFDFTEMEAPLAAWTFGPDASWRADHHAGKAPYGPPADSQNPLVQAAPQAGHDESLR